MESTIHCAHPADAGCRSRIPDYPLLELSGARGLQRGDIISFKPPASARKLCQGTRERGVEFIKRIMGVGGDRLRESNGVVYLNGRRLSEAYVQPFARDHGHGSWRVPAGSLFVMGDNRVASCDSRDWGAVRAQNIVGRVIEVIRPTAGGSVSVGPPIVHVQVPPVAFEISGPSMEPTLRCARTDNAACTGRGDDMALLARTGSVGLRRQEVISFRITRPPCPAKQALERVIGLGGDRVTESHGTVSVNGARLDEPYVPASERDHRSGSWQVPHGSVFVMADYRSRACDSRLFGPVRLSAIQGKIVEIFRPRNPR
jgi:signal peptidase I